VGPIAHLHYNRLKPEDLAPPERRIKWLSARPQSCNYRNLLIQRADRVVRPYGIRKLGFSEEWLSARPQICNYRALLIQRADRVVRPYGIRKLGFAEFRQRRSVEFTL